MADHNNQPTAPKSQSLQAAVARTLGDLCETPLPAGLYLVATPIGNLGDISLRALAVLSGCQRLYCEDTRTSQVLLSRYGIARRLGSYHEHNGDRMRPEILRAIDNGESVALITDAGTPAVSDPGFKLASAVRAAGHSVVPIPGPSALVTAISAGGLPTDRFLFAGFLAPKSAARCRQLNDLADTEATLIFYESPHRLSATLKDMLACFGDRAAVIARELTKRYEEFKHGSLSELESWSSLTPPRGEITILVGPPAPVADADISDEAIADHLREAQDTASPSQAAKRVADTLGVTKSRVYDVGLRMKRGEL